MKKAELAKEAEAEAHRQATDLSRRMSSWLGEVVKDPRCNPRDRAADPGFGSDDLADVDWTDPPVALASADIFARTAANWAHQAAAEARSRAREAAIQAATFRQQAGERRDEARRIRDDGLLLPLPRPEWAGDGDDTLALGNAVDWAEGVDSETQGIVEATVAAAGLLGATLTPGGATTEAWAVAAEGPTVERNLLQVLRPDPTHPLADAAAAVLRRVPCAETAMSGPTDGLVIGTDGTFRAGVLVAAVPEARDPDRRSP